jgi:hypothetical protein
MQKKSKKKYNYEIKENQTPNPKEIWIQKNRIMKLRKTTSHTSLSFNGH